MSDPNPSVVRVAMAKRLASRWLEDNSGPEYRVSVLEHPSISGLHRLLRAFRDGKSRIGSVSPIPDLGIRLGSNNLEIWAADRESLVQLDQWIRSSGYETTGIW